MYELRVGIIVNEKYRIDGVLGVGGFGITYKAYDIMLDRYVALKECMPSDFALRDSDTITVQPKTEALKSDFEWAKDRFLLEARTLARFKHKNLLSVNNIFAANGTVYMDSSMIDGKDLDTVAKSKGSFTEEEIRRIIEPLLEALSLVHKDQIMHRDIKPGNIIIKQNGDPVLIDFGSARLTVNSKSRPLTAMVTQGYAPFEQYYEDGNQGAWTDIYAIGAVAYKLITGKIPPESVSRVRSDTIEDLSAYANKYSQTLINFVNVSLKMDEKQRPQTCEEALAIIRGEVKVSMPQKDGRGYYEDGLTAYNRQDYKLAIYNWEKAAELSNGYAVYGVTIKV